MEAANSALLDSEEFLKTREAPAQVSGDTADMALSASHARIDRKLRSKNALGHAMSEEASNQWFTEFVACPDWNQKVWADHTGYANQRGYRLPGPTQGVLPHREGRHG